MMKQKYLQKTVLKVRRRLSVGLLASLLLAANLMPAVAYAASGSISVVANKATVPSGGSLIIAIYMNGGGNAVNAVQADLSYPASKLQYVGYSASGSAFEIAASNGGGDGTASIARATTGSVSGSGLVGTVTFRALVGSGSATIAVAGSSALADAGNPVPYSAGSVSVNFGAVAAAPSAAPAAPAAPAPPKDTTPPTITDIKTKSVTSFGAKVTWTTNEASDSVVEYGLDTSYGLSASSTTPVSAHEVALNSAFITPETVLHYRVKSTDGSGNVQTSPDNTLQIPGVPVTIIVRGSNGKPQSGVDVTLDGATGTTDNKGSVTLPSGLGNKQVTTTYQGATVHKPITIVKSAKPLPPYQLDLQKQPLNHWMLVSLGLLVGLLVLAGLDAFWFRSRLFARVTGLKFKHDHPMATGTTATAASVASLPAVAPAEPENKPMIVDPTQVVPPATEAPLISEVSAPLAPAWPTSTPPASQPTNIAVRDEGDAFARLKPVSKIAVATEATEPKPKKSAKPKKRAPKKTP